MRQRARRMVHAPPGIASMVSVATANATTNAWRVARRKREAVLMAFVDRSSTILIPIMIARPAPATGKTCARTTMVFLVLLHHNVYRTIASMVIAVATFAWARARPVRRRKRVVVAMEYAETLGPIPIPTMNAIPANAMGRERAIRVLKRRSPMVQHAHHRLNARPGFVPTAFVATVGVWGRAKLARQPRKTKA